MPKGEDAARRGAPWRGIEHHTGRLEAFVLGHAIVAGQSEMGKARVRESWTIRARGSWAGELENLQETRAKSEQADPAGPVLQPCTSIKIVLPLVPPGFPDAPAAKEGGLEGTQHGD